MQKKIIGLLSFVLLIFCGCVKKQEGPDLYQSIIQNDKLIVAMTFDSKPFSYIDKTGKFKGVEVDLVREIAQRMLGDKNKVVFKKVAPQDRFTSVLSDDIDIAVSAITITSKRRKIVDFSEPYFIAGQVVCVKKDSDIRSIDDLINKKVIILLGTTGEESINRFAPNSHIIGFLDGEEAIEEFKKGPAEAIITDDALLRGLTMENGDYIILPKRLTKEPYGIAFKKSGQSKAFKKKLNEIIEDIKNDGTFFMIEDKWDLL